MSTFYKKAFTLIELLVVIAIIGILSGLIVVAMGGVTDKANIAKSQVFANSMRNSLLLNLKASIGFDEGTGQTLGDTWGGSLGYLGLNSSVEASDPTWSTDCINKNCLDFGTDDFVSINSNSNLQFPGDVTISLWAYNGNCSGSVCTLISKKAQNNTLAFWYVYAGSGGIYKDRLNWQYSDGAAYQSVYWSAVFPFDKWSLLTFVYNQAGHTVTLYVNGISQGVKSTPSSLPVDNTDALYIGTYQGSTSGTYNFKGRIDEVQFFNAVVSISQIRKQYFIGLNKLLVDGLINGGEYLSIINSLSINE